MMLIYTHTLPVDWSDNETPCWLVAAFIAPKEIRKEISKWCYETFGESEFNHLTHQTRWKNWIPYGEVHFSRIEDLEWFLLRWS